jgi:hypothetical protein
MARTLLDELWAMSIVVFMGGGILVSYTAYGYAQEALKQRVPIAQGSDATERFEDSAFLLVFQCLTSCIFALAGMALWPFVGWLWDAMAGPHARRSKEAGSHPSSSVAVWSVEAQTCRCAGARWGGLGSVRRACHVGSFSAQQSSSWPSRTCWPCGVRTRVCNM